MKIMKTNEKILRVCRHPVFYTFHIPLSPQKATDSIRRFFHILAARSRSAHFESADLPVRPRSSSDDRPGPAIRRTGRTRGPLPQNENPRDRKNLRPSPENPEPGRKPIAFRSFAGIPYALRTIRTVACVDWHTKIRGPRAYLFHSASV